MRYWIIFLNNGFNTVSLSNKDSYFREADMSYYYMAAFNSNLFWWYYALNFDMFNLKDYMIFSFRLTYSKDDSLTQLAKMLEMDLNKKKLTLVESKSIYEWNYQKQLLSIQVGMGQSQPQSKTELTKSVFSEEYLLERPLLKSIRSEKPVVLLIDEIDKVLAAHYGFSEEELDFIINYDIKYRMGDELGGEE